MRFDERTFYRRWIVVNGWAEAIGLGTTFLVGGLAAPLLEREADAAMVLAGAAAAVLLGAFLEGLVVGVAQEGVLRQRLVELRPGGWIVATAAGAGLAWLLGMIPSTVMALSAPGSSPSAGASFAEPPFGEPSAAVQYALAALLGLIVGPILGLAQWTMLRRHVRRAGRWLWANALAWAIGMPMIFLGMDHVPWTAHPVVKYLAIYALCGATGTVVGAVHGWFLVRLLRSRLTGLSFA